MPFLTQGKANIKYLLIVVLVAAVAGGIIFAARSCYQKEMVNLSGLTEANQQKQIFEDETADWKTYRNEEYGFEFKYPKDWLFDEAPSGGAYNGHDIHISNSRMSEGLFYKCEKGWMGMEIQTGNQKDPNKDFINQLVSYAGTDLGFHRDIELLEGHRAIEFFEGSAWQTTCGGQGYAIEQDSNHFTWVNTGYYSGNGEIFKQIISTFKFTR